MKRKNLQRVRFITLSATIAALYVVLTLIAAAMGLASNSIQIRFSEALCVLTFFTPAAVPGLTIGCFIANLITGAAPLDLFLGTFATFLGAIGGYYLRKSKWIITLPTVLANTLIIPFVIVYGYDNGSTVALLPLYALTIFIGEFISAAILGTGLLAILKRYKFKWN